MKKIKVYCIFYGVVCLLALTGVLIAMIIDIIQTNHPDYFTLNILEIIITGFCAFLFGITVHEITHVIAFRCNKMKLRLVYIFPFCYVTEQNRIRISMNVNMQIGLGGIVIPEIPVVKNKEELKKLGNRIGNAVLAAPICSTILGIICLLLAIFVTDRISSQYRSAFFIFMFASILMALYINFMSLLSISGIIGDYTAARLLNKNYLYLLLQVYTYYTLQNENIKKAYKADRFIYDEMLSYLDERLQNENSDAENIGLIDMVVYETLLLSKKNKSERFQHTWNEILKKLEFLESKIQFEAYYRCYCHILMLLYMKGEQGMAAQLWEKNKEKIPKTKIGKYTVAQVEMLIEKKENADISKSKNIHISSLDNLLSHIDNYFDDEIQLNKSWREII